MCRLRPPHEVLMRRTGSPSRFSMVMPNVNSGPILSVGAPNPAVSLPFFSVKSEYASPRQPTDEIQTLSQTRGLPSGPRISLRRGAVFGSSARESNVATLACPCMFDCPARTNTFKGLSAAATAPWPPDSSRQDTSIDRSGGPDDGGMDAPQWGRRAGERPRPPATRRVVILEGGTKNGDIYAAFDGRPRVRGVDPAPLRIDRRTPAFIRWGQSVHYRARVGIRQWTA